MTKVDTTIGQVNFSQALFNWAGYDVWRASQAFTKAAYYNAQSSRGLVVLNVGNTYLQALAAKARLDYAQALLKTDETAFNQAHEEHLAGVVANLDELRARVQLQSQQQTVIAAQNNFEKAKIALNRQIGLRPEQPIVLTESALRRAAPDGSGGRARTRPTPTGRTTWALKQELIVAERERAATRHERFPTLTFGGNWGVTGVTGGVYHETFAAVGTLSIPIFKEAEVSRRSRRGGGAAGGDPVAAGGPEAEDRSTVARQPAGSADGDRDRAGGEEQCGSGDHGAGPDAAALYRRHQRQPARRRGAIDAGAGAEPVREQRVSLNEARLGLARNLGIIDTQYRTFLQGGNPPQVKSDQGVGEPKKE